MELTYLSAVLCDPFLLPAYKGLAAFYHVMGKRDLAVGMCRQYDETEARILHSQDPYVRVYRETRYAPLAANTRRQLDSLKTELGLR